MIKLFDQFVADISSYQISLSIAAIAVSFLMLIIVQRKVKSAWRNYYRYYGKKKYGYYKKHYGYYSKSYGYGYRQHKEENKENIEE